MSDKLEFIVTYWPWPTTSDLTAEALRFGSTAEEVQKNFEATNPAAKVKSVEPR